MLFRMDVTDVQCGGEIHPGTFKALILTNTLHLMQSLVTMPDGWKSFAKLILVYLCRVVSKN
jgi:hypothetical protein